MGLSIGTVGQDSQITLASPLPKYIRDEHK